MDITNKIDILLNENSGWQKGMWIVQRRSDANTYGILVDQLKNKAWSVVSKSDERAGGKATKGSTKGWYPPPEVVDAKDVPPKIKEKVKQKLKQLGIDLQV
jgi:hypothetical protein